MTDRVAVLTIALSEASWEEIEAACTAASGYRILVRLSNAGGASHVAYKCKTNAPRRWSVSGADIAYHSCLSPCAERTHAHTHAHHSYLYLYLP